LTAGLVPTVSSFVIPRPPSLSTRLARRWRRDLLAAGVLVAAWALLAAAPAWAQGGGAGSGVPKITRLNKQALDAFDSLNFDQAKTLLEEALTEADNAGLNNDESAARTHLNMGMLLIAGFQQKEQAIDHFKAALKARPDIAAPAGLFNPEVQTVFDEVKENMKTEPEPPQPRPRPVPVAKESGEGADGKGEGEGEEEEEAAGTDQPTMFLALGLGSGFGYANSHLDANKDVFQGPNADNSWTGVAPSRLGHLVASVGYFVSPKLVLSLEGRIQIVSGTTPTGTTKSCVPSCKSPSSAFAGLLKASWFFSSDVVSPFVSGGVGGGSIRQVVKLNGVSDCGNGSERCIDTVTGGPLLLAAGGGVAYRLGKVALLGSVTANVGVPNFMLNVDAVLGLGLRL
jgi:hypothetical protein